MPDTPTKPKKVVLSLPSPVLVTLEQESPSDPELRKIAQDVLNQMKFSFMANAVTAKAPSKMKVEGSADVMFQKYLATRKPSVRAVAKQKSQIYLEEPVARREKKFGRYGKLTLNQYSQVGSAGVSTKVDTLQVDSISLKATLKKPSGLGPRGTTLPIIFYEKKGAKLIPLNPVVTQPVVQPPVVPVVDEDKLAGAQFKKLRLFIKSVYCQEETDEVGDDSILIGGTAIDLDGTTQKIDQFKVVDNIDDDFQENETKEYPGNGKLFAEWNISSDDSAGWPKAYPALMAMSEEDDGGFYEFLVELWKMVSGKVVAAVEEAVGAAIGTLIGAAFGGVIGAIAGFIVGAFVQWIINLFDNEDDIVAVEPMTLWLGAATASYYASTGFTTAPSKLFATEFVGDGGHYRVWCHYKISVA
jgi:hypothetical protein